MSQSMAPLAERRRRAALHGRRGDPRMNRAVEAKRDDPQLSLLDALLVGGFIFPDFDPEVAAIKVHDTDGVTLYQRKNQLMRRLRAPGKKALTFPVSSSKKKSSSTDVSSRKRTAHSLDFNVHEEKEEIVSFNELCLEDMVFDEMMYPDEQKKEQDLLSENEKAEIVNDLYGVSKNQSACFPVTYDELHDFDEALNEIDYSKKVALVEAQERCPELVSEKEKEVFLKWADYDVKHAVERFVTYWIHRQQLFGAEAFLPMTLERTLGKDKITLQAGIWSALPGKDKHGRALIWMDPGRRDPKIHSAESEVRCLWCIIHNALKDETVQEKGFVFLFYGQRCNILKNYNRRTHELLWGSCNDWLPINVRAMHFIRPPPFASVVGPVMHYLFGHRLRQRVRFHSGNNKEILKSLSEHGIPDIALPVEIGGQFI